MHWVRSLQATTLSPSENRSIHAIHNLFLLCNVFTASLLDFVIDGGAGALATASHPKHFWADAASQLSSSRRVWLFVHMPVAQDAGQHSQLAVRRRLPLLLLNHESQLLSTNERHQSCARHSKLNNQCWRLRFLRSMLTPVNYSIQDDWEAATTE